MRRMGIEALYRRPRTTKPEPGHKIYPYLLRGMEITRPNQVWAMDITYIPMARGFVYLAVVLDWATRRVLSWRLSITMEAAFCVETLEDALARHGKPEIFNTDQGSQFTGAAFTGVLASNGIAISMDGKGAWRDNVFVERLWRSVKYEEVYLRAYESVGEARPSIGRYLDFYNGRRPHSSLDDMTPDQAYFTCRRSAWRPNPGRAPLIDAEILFRQPGPAVTKLTLLVTEPLMSDALSEPSVDINAFRLNSVPEKLISKFIFAASAKICSKPLRQPPQILISFSRTISAPV